MALKIFFHGISNGLILQSTAGWILLVENAVVILRVLLVSGNTPGKVLLPARGGSRPCVNPEASLEMPEVALNE